MGQRLDDFDGGIEGHDGDAVIGTQAADNTRRAFEGRFERATAHRAGAVDDQGEVEGCAGGLSDIRRFDRGDDTDEDMRRIRGGAEEALLEGQDFNLGLVHGRSHHPHFVPPSLKCQHRQRYFLIISTLKLLSQLQILVHQRFAEILHDSLQFFLRGRDATVDIEVGLAPMG